MQGKILIVEDDPAIQQLLKAVLEASGHEVHGVADGLSAHPAARELRPDVVLCDVGLPGIDGFAVLGLLKDDLELQHIPVLMVTAWAEPVLVAKALDRGAHDYVRKPFDIAELTARVEAALRIKGESDFLAGSSERADEESARDALTALPGRRHLDEVLDRQAMAARRTGRPFSVVSIHLDDFDRVGADLGAEVADDALRAAAKRLRNRARVSDVLGRWDGDAFMAVVPGTDVGGAGVLAEDLRVALAERPLDTPTAAVRVTASFGVAQFHPSERPGEAIARAGQALAEARAEGGNAVRLAGPAPEPFPARPTATPADTVLA